MNTILVYKNKIFDLYLSYSKIIKLSVEKKW